MLETQYILSCHSCGNHIFNARENGDIVCTDCTLIIGYNRLSNTWTPSLDDGGIGRCSNATKFNTYADLPEDSPEEIED